MNHNEDKRRKLSFSVTTHDCPQIKGAVCKNFITVEFILQTSTKEKAATDTAVILISSVASVMMLKLFYSHFIDNFTYCPLQ